MRQCSGSIHIGPLFSRNLNKQASVPHTFQISKHPNKAESQSLPSISVVYIPGTHPSISCATVWFSEQRSLSTWRLVVFGNTTTSQHLEALERHCHCHRSFERGGLPEGPELLTAKAVLTTLPDVYLVTCSARERVGGKESLANN
jgi:hypothetical protein